MARPIKETPILQGDDAVRFIQRMGQRRVESPEKRRRRLDNYRVAMRMFVNK